MRISYSLVSKILNLFLLVGVIALFCIKGYIQSERKEVNILSATEKSEVSKEILHFFPEAVFLTPVDTTWIEVKGNEGNLLGYVLYTSPYADKVYGFAGKTPLLIALDPNQTVIGTVLLENNETPSYINRVKEAGLFESWTNLSVSDALDKKVDVISGATRTTDAVVKSFQMRMSILHNVQHKTSWNAGKIVKDIASILVIFFALYCFIKPQSGKKYRLVLLSLSVIVLGFWQGIFLSMEGFYGWTINGISFNVQYMLLIIFGLSILLPVLFGKSFYCQWLCPFGALQELVGKMNKKKWKLHSSVRTVLSKMRKYILLVIVFLLFLDVIRDLSYFEPFSAFNIRSASAFVLILAGVFLLLSFFISKPWCSFFCPTGQFLDTFKTLSLKHNKIHKNEE